MAEIVKGVIQTLEVTGDNTANVLVDNKTCSMRLGKKEGRNTFPKVGDDIGLYPNDDGVYGYLGLSSAYKPSGGGGSRGGYSNTYGKDRLEYEMNKKDPRLAKQGYNTTHNQVLTSAVNFVIASNTLEVTSENVFMVADSFRNWMLDQTDDLSTKYSG